MSPDKVEWGTQCLMDSEDPIAVSIAQYLKDRAISTPEEALKFLSEFKSWCSALEDVIMGSPPEHNVVSKGGGVKCPKCQEKLVSTGEIKVYWGKIIRYVLCEHCGLHKLVYTFTQSMEE